MSELAISLTIGGVMLILSVILLTGRGSVLIAGYNTLPKDEKAKYDKSALSKFMGKILLPLAILTALVGIDYLRDLSCFWIVWGIIFVGLLAFAVIYIHISNRFKK